MGEGLITRRNSSGVLIEFKNYYNSVEGLTYSTPTALSAARYDLAGASVGDYALFAGGYAGGGASNVVDAYSLIVKAYIPVTQGSKYKFTEGSEQTASTNTTLVYNQKVTGYVKYKKGKITM